MYDSFCNNNNNNKKTSYTLIFCVFYFLVCCATFQYFEGNDLAESIWYRSDLISFIFTLKKQLEQEIWESVNMFSLLSLNIMDTMNSLRACFFYTCSRKSPGSIQVNCPSFSWWNKWRLQWGMSQISTCIGVCNRFDHVNIKAQEWNKGKKLLPLVLTLQIWPSMCSHIRGHISIMISWHLFNCCRHVGISQMIVGCKLPFKRSN